MDKFIKQQVFYMKQIVKSGKEDTIQTIKYQNQIKGLRHILKWRKKGIDYPDMQYKLQQARKQSFKVDDIAANQALEDRAKRDISLKRAIKQRDKNALSLFTAGVKHTESLPQQSLHKVAAYLTPASPHG